MGLPILAYINAFALFLTTALGLVRYRRLSFALKIFAAFCIVLCVELVAEFALAFQSINNNFISNAGLGIEPMFLAAVYLLALDDARVRKVILALAVLFLCVWVPDKIFFENPKLINEAMCIISSIFIIIISVITLHTVARKTAIPVTDEPLFWITSANILMSTGDIFVLGMSNELLAMGVSYFTSAWYINWSLDIMSYILFTKAFLCKPSAQQ